MAASEPVVRECERPARQSGGLAARARRKPEDDFRPARRAGTAHLRLSKNGDVGAGRRLGLDRRDLAMVESSGLREAGLSRGELHRSPSGGRGHEDDRPGTSSEREWAEPEEKQTHRVTTTRLVSPSPTVTRPNAAAPV